MTETAPPDVAAVVIGRNEGDNLEICILSVAPQVDRIIYVDSGSTDGSLEIAERLGAEVVALDAKKPFTAARARNAGSAQLAHNDELGFVQFIDGDCELDPDWIDVARRSFEDRPDLAVVCGRLRERFPDASPYSRMLDNEWDTPVGPIDACGGIAMIRLQALCGVGVFNETLMAGEEPELCLRLRQAGWGIERIDAEMALHDAQMNRFDQWWKRTRRGGHAFAEGAAMHGHGPERHYIRQTRRAFIWGLILPLSVIVLTILIGPWALLAFLVYPLQWLRLQRSFGWQNAGLLVLGKFAEAQGVIDYWLGRFRN